MAEAAVEVAAVAAVAVAPPEPEQRRRGRRRSDTGMAGGEDPTAPDSANKNSENAEPRKRSMRRRQGGLFQE